MSAVDLPTSVVFARADARAINRDAVKALAESIREIGIINPMRVRPARRYVDGVEADAFEVTAGLHRLQAALKIGLETVPCIIADDDDLRAELAMIDENLCRAELSPAERAKQTARRKAIYEELHPEARAQVRQANVRWNAGAKLAPAFTSDTATATNKSERSVQRDAERGEKISERALSLIAGTALDSGAYLDKLKKLTPSEQEARVQRELAASRQKPISPAPEPLNEFEAYEKWLGDLTRVFNRGSAEWRERARNHLYPDTPLMDARYGPQQSRAAS